MNLNLTYRFLVLFLLILLYNCKMSSRNGNLITSSNSQIISQESFTEFYKQFINNDSFQIARLKFPIEGYYIEDNKKILWNKANWRLQKKSIFDIDTSEYKIIIIKTDTAVSTRIYKNDSEVDIQNKFILIKGKWYLVYHLDIFY